MLEANTCTSWASNSGYYRSLCFQSILLLIDKDLSPSNSLLSLASTGICSMVMDSMIAGGCTTCTKDEITCGLWESPTWAGVNMCKQPLALALPSFGFVGADAIIEVFKLEDVKPTG